MAQDQNDRYIELVINEVNQIANDGIQRFAFRLLSSLRAEPPMGTPIDTRWAANNWRISIDSPNEGEIDPPKPPFRSGRRPKVPLERVGEKELNAFNITKNRLIYIQNNAPYIEDLAEGSSPQQPEAGWIEYRIQDGLQDLMALFGISSKG